MTFRCAQVIFTDQGGHRRSIASTSPRRLSHRYKFEVESDGRLYANPRNRKRHPTTSEQLIGQELGAAKLLADLRKNVGVDTALGLPPGPNSGLTAKIVGT